MRLGLKLFLAALLAAVLVVPAATAGPGNGGGGNGGGKPSWAGQQGGGKANAGSQANGKPAWAGQGKAKGQAKKAEQAQRKLDRRAAAEDPAEGEELAEPLRDNPAFVCKFERDMTGAEAFADEYGTNENKANAFGMCVSQEAQARDGAEGSTEEPEAPAACEPAEGEEPVEGEDPVEGEEPSEGDEPVEGDDPAEGECPDDEDADSGEGDVEDGETDEGSEESSEDDGGSSADEILTALQLLL